MKHIISNIILLLNPTARLVDMNKEHIKILEEVAKEIGGEISYQTKYDSQKNLQKVVIITYPHPDAVS